MKKIFVIILYLYYLTVFKLSGQKKFCADSSIRIKFNFGYNNAELFNNPDTTGRNIFVGFFNQSVSPQRGIIVFKTNWGDSIFWSKRFYLNNTTTTAVNSFDAPGGSVICSGGWGNSSDLLICRIDTNSNLLWSKRYRLSQLHSGFNNGQGTIKNIFVTNNAIYANTIFYSNSNPNTYNIILKLDLNGSILWSKSFRKASPFIGNSISDVPVLYNDTVLFVSNIVEVSNISGQVLNVYFAITKLKDSDGSFIENNTYKIVPDNTLKGIIAKFIKSNNDNSFSITGTMCVPLPNGTPSYGSNLFFNLTLNNGLNPINNFYYQNNNAIGNEFTFDFNNSKQHAFLIDEAFSNNKYFITFVEYDGILRSRKFLLPAIGGFRSSLNFDDKQNIHFTYNYRQNNKAVVEYARISDLAPANTVSCFGIDTSILQPVPFTLTKEPFAWDIEYSNIVSSFPVNLIEAPDTITKQVVCKQVSYCDSLKIKGNQNICISGPDIRYSVYLNPQCLKSINWQIDTSFATLINAEADSAVTLRFKKAGQFYLKAVVNNCVVNDSLLITIPAIQTDLQLSKTDSILCPGETILLNTNPLFKTYQWQDGSNQNSYTVTTPGLYTITATDSCGSVVKDSISIKQDNTVIPGSPYYKICLYDTAKMLIPATISNITWQPPASAMMSGNRLLLYPMQTTAYTIQAQSPQGCNIQKQVTIETEVCPEWVRFPSAFTPNNDGLNDNFKPGVSGHLVSYNLKVFDRNGQIVFSSKNPFAGWDGTIKGVQQNSGIFVFMSYHRFINKEEVMQKGTMMLIR